MEFETPVAESFTHTLGDEAPLDVSNIRSDALDGLFVQFEFGVRTGRVILDLGHDLRFGLGLDGGMTPVDGALEFLAHDPRIC